MERNHRVTAPVFGSFEFFESLDPYLLSLEVFARFPSAFEPFQGFFVEFQRMAIALPSGHRSFYDFARSVFDTLRSLVGKYEEDQLLEYLAFAPELVTAAIGYRDDGAPSQADASRLGELLRLLGQKNAPGDQEVLAFLQAAFPDGVVVALTEIRSELCGPLGTLLILLSEHGSSFSDAVDHLVGVEWLSGFAFDMKVGFLRSVGYKLLYMARVAEIGPPLSVEQIMATGGDPVAFAELLQGWFELEASRG